MIGELAIGREIGAGLAVAAQAGAALLVAVVVARRACPGDRLTGSVVGAVAVLAQAAGIPLVLGVAGLLSLPAVLVAHAALGAGALVVARQHRAPVAEVRTTPPLGVLALAALAAGVAYVLVAADLSIGLPSADNDTREYHITNLAHWLREGSIWDLPFQSAGGVTATHPGDGELVALWLSLPSHGDELAYLMPVAFAVLALLAGALLARELRGGDPDAAALGSLGVLAALAAPLFFTSQVASLSTDLATGAAVLAALALLVASRRVPSVGVVVAAGAAIGLAVGSKYTALVPAAAVTLAALWLLPSRRQWWWLVPGVVVLALPWYVRNVVTTGNPLFPLELGPLPGGDYPLDVIDTSMAQHLVELDGDVIGRWVRLGRRLVGPIALVVALAIVLAFRPGPTRRPRAIVSLIVVASIVGYLLVPFSGGGPTGFDFLLASSYRYSLAALVVGGALLPALLPVRAGAVVIGAVLAWDAVRLRSAVDDSRADLVWSDRRAAVVVLVSLAVVVGWASFVRRPGARDALRRRTIPLLVAATAVVAAVSAAVVHRQDRGRSLTALEEGVLAFGVDEPIIVLGTGDLRSLLGPRLERPLLGVSRGGEADEVPFVDRAQIRRHFLDDEAAPPPPPELSEELDAALRAAPADLLAVGIAATATYPDGWAPDVGDWCRVAAFERVELYRRSVGGGCETAQ